MRKHSRGRLSLILILSVILTPGPISSSYGQAKDSFKELDAVLRSIIGEGEAGAAAMAMQKGEILFHSCYGLADIELASPVKPGTSFRIGSLSKQFTAVAAMILYERGILDIDLPVTRYLKACPSWYEMVSTRQLLNHTSGVSNFTNIPGIRSRFSEPISLDKLLRLIYDQPADAEPGAVFNYSNSGYVILGKIIENLSGKTLEDFIAEVIFKPTNMRNTMFWNEQKMVVGQAQGYEVRQGDTLRAESLHHGWTYGGGGITSTVEDMASWFKALLEYKLISSKSLDFCFTRSNLKDGSRINYGLGWYIEGEGDFKQVYHEGGVYGFVAYQSYIPSRNLFVIVLRNLIDFNTDYPAGKLASLMIYHLAENTTTDIVFVKGGLGPYAGEYRINLNKSIRRIEVRDNKLYYLSPPRDTTSAWRATLLMPASDSIFKVQKSQSYFKFSFDEAKKPNGFVIVQPGGGKEIHAERIQNL